MPQRWVLAYQCAVRFTLVIYVDRLGAFICNVTVQFLIICFYWKCLHAEVHNSDQMAIN